MAFEELRPLGFVASFERFAEGLDLIDVDSVEGYCDPRWTTRSRIWDNMFASLADATACRQVFASLRGKRPQLMTVASRKNTWLEIIRSLQERMDVVTFEEFTLEPGVGIDTIVVDDPTLAENVASDKAMKSVKVKTLESSVDGPPKLRSIRPRQAVGQ